MRLHAFTNVGLASVLASVLGLALATPATAQNGSSYHALSNGMDVVYYGVGAGSAQDACDGIGTYIPGEDLRGPRLGPGNTFAYRQTSFTEQACVLNGSASGALTLHFRAILWVELGGLSTGHTPIVFPNPRDRSCAGFPLGGSSGFIPFGTSAVSSASFVVAGIPSGVGTCVFPVPNEGLVPSTAGGLLTMLGIAYPNPTPIASTGFCWTTMFQWVPSAMTSREDANNGWWHWVTNNALGNQYWALSADELNVFKSHTIASDAGTTVVRAFTANVEYAMTMTSADPTTNLATAPTNFFASGPYNLQTQNLFDGNGQPAANPNLGFDLGGHGTLSLTGTSGVPSVNTGLSPQDPAGVGGIAPSGAPLVPTLGFWSYDGVSLGQNGVADGSKRLVWMAFDTDHTLGIDPSLSPDLTVAGGTVRVPVPLPTSFPTFPQPVTTQVFQLFWHETAPCPGCPASPIGPGAPAPMGGSTQLPLPPSSICAAVAGAPIALAYGSSGLRGPTGVGAAAAGITWDQTEAATSGSKTMFLFE